MADTLGRKTIETARLRTFPSTFVDAVSLVDHRSASITAEKRKSKSEAIFQTDWHRTA